MLGKLDIHCILPSSYQGHVGSPDLLAVTLYLFLFLYACTGDCLFWGEKDSSNLGARSWTDLLLNEKSSSWYSSCSVAPRTSPAGKAQCVKLFSWRMDESSCWEHARFHGFRQGEPNEYPAASQPASAYKAGWKTVILNLSLASPFLLALHYLQLCHYWAVFSVLLYNLSWQEWCLLQACLSVQYIKENK